MYLDRQMNTTSVQFISVAQSCLTLCDPMNHSTTVLPVHHLLPEFTQTQVHQVSDAIQPSHPLSSPSPPAPNPSQHQGLFHYIKTCYFFFSISVVFNYISSLPNHGRSVALYFVAWINIFWGTYGSVYKLPMVYGFPCGSAGKESAYKKKKSAYNEGDLGSIPGLGRSPGEVNGYPLQNSGLENSMGSQRVGQDWASFTTFMVYGIVYKL